MRIDEIFIFFAVLWLYTCIGSIYQLIPALEFLQSPVNVLCDGTIILLALTTIRRRSLKYLYMFFAVIFVGIISYIHNYGGISLVQFFNGVRSIVSVFFSLIFITNMFYGKKRIQFYQAMNAFILTYLILQIPVSIWQAAVFGVGTDSIGGTLGGDHSGNMSILIYLCSFFVLMQNFDGNKILKSLFANKWLILCWIPSFINETKITFILMIIFFVLCLNISFAKIHKNIILISLAAAMLFLYLYAYQKTESAGRGLGEILTGEYYIAEFTGTGGTDPLAEKDLQRSLRIILTLSLLTEDNFTIIFGKSFGHFNINSMNYTDFAKKYDYLVKGSNPFFTIILLQVGILGFFIVYLAMFIGISDRKSILPRFNNNHNKMRSFLIAVLILVSYYNTALRNFIFPVLFFYLGIWASSPDYIRKELEATAFTRVKIRFHISSQRNNAYCAI